jgi:hypothetical protein
MKYKVRFLVEYETEIEVESEEDLSDAVNDIDIPENENCFYAVNSFIVLDSEKI